MPKRKNMGPNKPVDPFDTPNLSLSGHHQPDLSFDTPMLSSSMSFEWEEDLSFNFEKKSVDPLIFEDERSLENPVYIPELDQRALPTKKAKLDSNPEAELKAIIQ